jgi:hypothetical protein
MEIHTNKLIHVHRLKAKHMEICNNYKNSITLDETNAIFESVRSWWHSTCVATRIDLEELNH